MKNQTRKNIAWADTEKKTDLKFYVMLWGFVLYQGEASIVDYPPIFHLIQGKVLNIWNRPVNEKLFWLLIGKNEARKQGKKWKK